MLEKVMYECGCLASGDNVSAHCPIHGDGILSLCKHAESCKMSTVFGGFPMCYDPFCPAGHPCSDYEVLEHFDCIIDSK